MAPADEQDPAPRVAMDAPRARPTPSAVVPALPGASLVAVAGTHRARVLLVEDDADNQFIYATVLRHVGHEVFVADDGTRGLALARSARPHVILMDVSVPAIDGWEATRALKDDPTTRDVRIIALTARALDADRARAREVGCDGYLAKPVDPHVVLAEVGRHLAELQAHGAMPAGPAVRDADPPSDGGAVTPA